MLRLIDRSKYFSIRICTLQLPKIGKPFTQSIQRISTPIIMFSATIPRVDSNCCRLDPPQTLTKIKDLSIM